VVVRKLHVLLLSGAFEYWPIPVCTKVCSHILDRILS